MFLDKFTGGEKPPTQIINAFSTGGAQLVTESPSTIAIQDSKIITLTGMTANTYKTALSITGEGKLHFARLAYSTTTPITSTMKARVTVDGKVIFDPSMSSTQGGGAGWSAVYGINIVSAFAPVYFASSLLIEAMVNDTQDVRLQTIYNLY